MGKDFLYNAITGSIAGQIRSGVLKAGDRLPSVRGLCQEHGVSINTAKRVFLELEAQSLIYSKPQSGYFVNQLAWRHLPLPAISRPSPVAGGKEPNEIISSVFANMGRDDLTLLSIGAPAGALLPLAKLKKEIVHATRTLSDGGTAYDSVQGNATLRRMVAVRSSGSCMPDEHKAAVVALLAQHNIPLIEDDVYGDLYFGAKRPKCCKSFDKEGNVL